MKTLIVEDDPTSRLLLQEYLKVYGAIDVAVNGKEAVEAVRLDVATQLGDTLERLLRRNITEEQKRAYQEEMLSEVRV